MAGEDNRRRENEGLKNKSQKERKRKTTTKKNMAHLLEVL